VKNLTNELSIYKRGPKTTSTLKRSAYQRKRKSSTEKGKDLKISMCNIHCTRVVGRVCTHFLGLYLTSNSAVT